MTVASREGGTESGLQIRSGSVEHNELVDACGVDELDVPAPAVAALAELTMGSGRA